MGECFILSTPDIFYFGGYSMKSSLRDKVLYFSGRNCIEIPICYFCEHLDGVCIEQLGHGPPRDCRPVVLARDERSDNPEYGL